MPHAASTLVEPPDKLSLFGGVRRLAGVKVKFPTENGDGVIQNDLSTTPPSSLIITGQGDELFSLSCDFANEDEKVRE